VYEEQRDNDDNQHKVGPCQGGMLIPVMLLLTLAWLLDRLLLA
jgi:hypothetical protein